MNWEKIFDKAEKEYDVYLGVNDRYTIRKFLEDIPFRKQWDPQVSCYIRRLLLELGYNSRYFNNTIKMTKIKKKDKLIGG